MASGAGQPRDHDERPLHADPEGVLRGGGRTRRRALRHLRGFGARTAHEAARLESRAPLRRSTVVGAHVYGLDNGVARSREKPGRDAGRPRFRAYHRARCASARLGGLDHSRRGRGYLPQQRGRHRLRGAGGRARRLRRGARHARCRRRQLPHPAVVWIAFPVGIQRRRLDGAGQRPPPILRARQLEGPHLSMSSRPRQVPTRSSDDANQQTSAISGRGAILAFILLFVFLYAVRWALLPFVLAAVVAYICTPLVQWLANRTRLPRLLFVCAIVIALLAAGTAVA